MRAIDADKLLRDTEKYHVSDGKFQHWVQIQPTIEPETCKDAVSRADVLECFADLYDTFEDCQKGIINELHRKFEDLRTLPSVTPKAGQPEWNNHTVACLLADLFGDSCACNYNGIDEWLPEKCEVIDSCPDPVGVACWEQFLKHRKKEEDKANGNT